jgi:hypothetical protein
MMTDQDKSDMTLLIRAQLEEQHGKRPFVFKDNWKGIVSIILLGGIIFIAGGILI